MTKDEGLRCIEANQAALTPRQLEVLRILRDRQAAADALPDGQDVEVEDEPEIIHQGRRVLLGLVPLSNATLNALIRACAITRTQDTADGFDRFERWQLNETGRGILKARGL